MKQLIYFLAIYLLMACERQPLRISPMTADNPGKRGTAILPVPGFYYPENFVDDKQGLKELMSYVNDTIRKQLPFDNDEPYFLYICKKIEDLNLKADKPI